MLGLVIPPKTAGERFRRPAWRRVSPVPMHAVCEAANRLRERVAVRFDADAEVFADVPFVPGPEALGALVDAAEVFEIRAPQGRAWIVLARATARRLVGLAFGEATVDAYREWSPIESRTLLTLMRDVAACLGPLTTSAVSVQRTGDHDRVVRETRHAVGFHLNAPLDAEMYCMLGFDPAIGGPERVPAARLMPVSLPVRAVAGTVRLTCGELGALQIGTVLPMINEGTARLFVGTTEVARGACGVIGGRLAFRIGDSDESRGV